MRMTDILTKTIVLVGKQRTPWDVFSSQQTFNMFLDFSKILIFRKFWKIEKIEIKILLKLCKVFVGEVILDGLS